MGDAVPDPDLGASPPRRFPTPHILLVPFPVSGRTAMLCGPSAATTRDQTPSLNVSSKETLRIPNIPSAAFPAPRQLSRTGSSWGGRAMERAMSSGPRPVQSDRFSMFSSQNSPPGDASPACSAAPQGCEGPGTARGCGEGPRLLPPGAGERGNAPISVSFQSVSVVNHRAGASRRAPMRYMAPLVLSITRPGHSPPASWGTGGSGKRNPFLSG